MKIDTSIYPPFYSAASDTNRRQAVDTHLTAGPSNKAGDFYLPVKIISIYPTIIYCDGYKYIQYFFENADIAIIDNASAPTQG
jgi:hypothetical protein